MEKQKVLKMDCDIAETNTRINGNTIIMLSLISESSKRGWIGITKLQKLSFLTEYYLGQQGKRAFGHRFFMYDHGPISKGVYNDLELLLNEELVVEDESGIRTSDVGNDINEQFKNILPKEVEEVMQSVIRRFACMSTNDLTSFVHNMKITLPSGTVAKIDDLDRGCIVIQESPKGFKVRSNVMETFNILSNTVLRETIRATRKNGSKSSPYKPMLS